MKPTVISNAQGSGATKGDNGGAGVRTASQSTTTNGMNIPISHEYGSGPYHHQQQQPSHYADAGPNASFGSPNAYMRQQPQNYPQSETHFEPGFGFEPELDMDMDMFPRGRLGRMHHDPFGGFGGSHFSFPQFGSMSRRRTGDHRSDDHDFFHRLPSEFRQYMPENFGHRRAGSGSMPQQQTPPMQGQYYHNYPPTGNTPPNSGAMPHSTSKTVCDAAIQTEDPTRRGDEVDAAAPMQSENLNQHGLRNTVDLGVKSTGDNEVHGPRSHSAPPSEQQQSQGMKGSRQTPASVPQNQQRSQVQSGQNSQQPQDQHCQKSYYTPQQQSHPQQKQNTPPPPQTPGGTYVRTIPIFVEGRSEPIINSHKEIPNQNGVGAGAGAGAGAEAAATANAFTPQQQKQQYYQTPQQQNRPPPFNTQQAQQHQLHQQANAPTVSAQTPHTMDSINKIQDIQRDVLDLMGKVEKFTGTRQDKEYVYLDEMLTRNLLKLDTIDTNGKDSIRLARKEAIKCIQASINVLEAKAEENSKTAQAASGAGSEAAATTNTETAQEYASADELTKETAIGQQPTATVTGAGTQPADLTKNQEPIPLPPPEGIQTTENEQQTPETGKNRIENEKEATPESKSTTEAIDKNATVESK